MAALEGPGSKSGLLSLINRDQERVATTRSYTSAMATTVVSSPTSMSIFSSNGGPPPPPYSGWSGPSTQSSSGLMSPPESRRTSDNKSDLPPPIQTHRPSLPSLHEALFTGAPKNNPYTSPVSASIPPSQNPLQFSQAPSVPRTYPAEHASYPTQPAPSQVRRPSSPQPAQPHQRPRMEPTSSFSESRSFDSAPGPPPNPYRFESSRYETDPRATDRLNGYTHNPPPVQQPSHQYGPPPGHPSATDPPRQYSHPQYAPRDRDGEWKASQTYKSEPEFSHGLKRHLDVWDFENNLAQINTSSRVLMEWSYHYNAIAQEQQRGTNVIPDRMPTLESCKEMMEHGDVLARSLQRMRDMIQQQELHVMDQRMRDQGGKGRDYDDEMAMYGDDMSKHGFGSADGKKQRRGRAAPPGRCHSCNRAETPEWRRGPDGARTLCNACGLHYAKLTRKQQMKPSQGSNGSALRPKSRDDNAPRPN